MFTLEIEKSNLQAFKFYLVITLREAKKEFNGSPFSLANSYDTKNIELCSSDLKGFFLAGAFLGLGYDGTPAGGSFYQNWNKFLKMVKVVEDKPS